MFYASSTLCHCRSPVIVPLSLSCHCEERSDVTIFYTRKVPSYYPYTQKEYGYFPKSPLQLSLSPISVLIFVRFL